VFRDKPFDSLNLRWWHKVFDDLGINAELREAGLLSKALNADGEFEEHFVFHGMRHTFATWLARLDVPREIIKAIGGWAEGKDESVAIYTHIADVSHLLPYVRKIDAVLNGKIKVLAHF
jgi:integrase